MKRLEDFLRGVDVYRCNDDALVRQFMVETGNAGVLKDEGKESWTQYITVGTHPSHWLLFSYHAGYPRAQDNGYNLLAMSKRIYTMEKANAVMQFVTSMASASEDGPKLMGQFDPKKKPGTN